LLLLQLGSSVARIAGFSLRLQLGATQSLYEPQEEEGGERVAEHYFFSFNVQKKVM
tara:strand:- start:6333 stop:6500 length:168 start_codon:yes stop_codon:yes gene_type:complete